MNNLDDRIRAALHAAVDGLSEQDLRPADPPVRNSVRRPSVRWLAPLLAAAAVVTAAAVTVAITSSHTASHQPGGGGPTPPVVVTPVRISSSQAVAPDGGLGGNEPLWPFATLDEADHWKNVDAPNGHSPWHADAKATALFFATGYLRFHDITKVTSVDIAGARADIGVGYDLPGGDPHTASVIHLLLFGDDSGPWEVVGATGDGVSITEPAAGTDGSLPTGPMHVSGRITGVDENVTVALHTLDGSVRTAPSVPAGGEDQPWSVLVPNPLRGVLTIVASTGGHLTAHERFDVVGVVNSGS